MHARNKVGYGYEGQREKSFPLDYCFALLLHDASHNSIDRFPHIFKREVDIGSVWLFLWEMSLY